MSSIVEPYRELLPFITRAEFLSKSLIRAVKMELGHLSSWRGRHIGRYIERKRDKLEVSGPFPLDLVQGHLIEPRTNLMDGSWPIRTRFDNVEALVVVLAIPGWQILEWTHRNFFHSWARRIDGPIFASLLDGHGVWASTSWVITAKSCVRIGTFAGACESYEEI